MKASRETSRPTSSNNKNEIRIKLEKQSGIYVVPCI